MSQNRPDSEQNKTTTGAGSTGSSDFGTAGSTGTTGYGGAGTGATDLGTTRDTSTGLTTGGGLGTTGGAAAGTARGLQQQAKDYGQKVADAATHAKDYLSDKATVVGDKIQDLRNKDYQQIADEAKDYARQKPGQALLVAAAAGFVIGLLLRGGRR